MTSPPPRPRLAAPVSGYASWEFARLLDECLPELLERRRRAGFHPELIAELRRQWGDVRAAGAEWHAWRISVDASSEVAPAQIGRSSGQEITPGQAAQVLEVTPERVRQLLRSGTLAGRKVGRSWLTTPGEVEAYKVGRVA